VKERCVRRESSVIRCRAKSRMTSWECSLAVVACSLTLLLAPAIARAQSQEVQQRIAALKQSVAQDQQNLRQYEWVETTVVSLKGEEKFREQKQCYYGADGGLQKTTVSETAQQKKPGLRGHVVEKKKAELTDYMKQAVALVKTYVPPDPARIQAVKDAGKVGVDLPGGGHGARVNFKDYAKPGDLLTVEVDPASNRVMGLTVATYLDDIKDAVTLNVSFASLQDGTRYPASEVLEATAKNLTVNVSNAGYRKMGN
jgi:hypothetical protein